MDPTSDLADVRDVLAARIREIPDFPQPGVLFRDLGPALADAAVFRSVVAALVESVGHIDAVVAVEARGFLVGAAVAHALGAGVVGVRKPGKLPLVADRETYALEYGTATLELPHAALTAGQRVLVVDDVLATGGTVAAACTLAERAGATVTGIAVVVEISALGGRRRLAGRALRALLAV